MGRTDYRRRYWFIADPHFGHANILVFEPNRAKILKCNDIAQHDASLVVRFNKQIRPQDVVYFLGDIGHNIGMIPQINGIKYLIRGNHDKYSDEQYRRAGFTAVLHEAIIKLGGYRIRLSHYPYRESWYKMLWRKLFGHVLRDAHKRPINDGKWLLHGHIHSMGKTIPYGKQIHVGLDVWECNPVSWEQVHKIITEHTKG